MGNKPAHVVNAEINQIRRLLEVEPFLTGREIQQRLNIPERRYHRYLNKMNEQDKEAWQYVIMESLETRALKIKHTYEWGYQKIKEIAEDPTTDDRVKIDAIAAMAQIQVSLFHLRKKGPMLGIQPVVLSNEESRPPVLIR
jgi:hypothetical protein